MASTPKKNIVINTEACIKVVYRCPSGNIVYILINNLHAQKPKKMASRHVLVIPYPAQGHIIPLMELSHSLVDHGFNITFVNTDFNHTRLLNSLPKQSGGKIHKMIKLISIPNGLEPEDDQNDLGRLCEESMKVMPIHIEEIIWKSDASEFGKITWMIVDKNMAWAIDVAKKLNVRVGALWPGPAALLAVMFNIPKFIKDGILDKEGRPTRHETIGINPGMPKMNTTQFAWLHVGNTNARTIIFHYITNNCEKVKETEFILCNSFYELELPVFTYMPNLIPIGPLITDQHLEKSVGSFWPEDESCVKWLDKQPNKSVIYIAFGSFTLVNHEQFKEIALGLELTNQPFLWVVRPDMINGLEDPYPFGFKERVVGRGMIVEWCPQQKVLAHPSTACFFSHCGWNSTVEGVRNGVPFLCWPYFCDQFLNESYICDVWRIGLRMKGEEDGMVFKEDVKAKVEELLGDKDINERAFKLKEMASDGIREGGSSFKNFNEIVKIMKSASPT